MITVHISPALYRSSSGQNYLVSGCHWLPVPDGTTLADTGLYMTVESPVIPSSGADTAKDSKGAQSDSDGVYEVTGSTGKTYDVQVFNGYFSCTCTGFKWRRKCRHIDEIKAERGANP